MKQLFAFEKFTVYQRALAQSQQIYTVSQDWPREHLFGLTDQLRRASLSVVLNIAEGSSRTNKDFRHFLIIARGSCFESIPLIQMAHSLKLLQQTQFESVYQNYYEIAKMLSSFRSSLEKRAL